MLSPCVKFTYNYALYRSFEDILPAYYVLFVRSPQDAPAEEPKQIAVSCIPVPEETQPPDHKSAQDDPADVVKPLQNPSDVCLFAYLIYPVSQSANADQGWTPVI